MAKKVLKSSMINTVDYFCFLFSYDPVGYPLLYPKGDYGFELYAEKDDNGKKLSTLNFYQYRLMVREDGEYVVNRHERDYVSLLHRGSRCFQEFLCDLWSKVEGERLRWISKNQSQLRAECYQGLVDCVRETDENVAGKKVGIQIKLPGTSGQENFQDCMGT